MKISSVTNNFFPNTYKKAASKAQSFKAIYIQDKVNLGEVAEKKGTAKFLPKDYLQLNDIASQYPNQDCFISSGYSGFPRLEYRERPPQVQVYSKNLANEYNVFINPKQKDYQLVPLLLDGTDNLTRYIGLPSYISTNPSLPFTVQAGYELHKKLIEKKYEILKGIGKTGDGRYDIGDDILLTRAHREIEDVESAVTRYLLECSFAALTDKASGSQIYASVYPKIQSRFEEKRKFDLTTSLASKEREKFDKASNNDKFPDICKIAMDLYPDKDENKKRIEQLKNHMGKLGVALG